MFNDQLQHTGYNFLVTGFEQGGYNSNLNAFDVNSSPNPAYAALNKIPIDEPQILDGYRAFNGLVSSAYDNLWSNLNNNVGGVYNRYNKSDNDLATLQVTSGFDFLPGVLKVVVTTSSLALLTSSEPIDPGPYCLLVYGIWPDFIPTITSWG